MNPKKMTRRNFVKKISTTTASVVGGIHLLEGNKLLASEGTRGVHDLHELEEVNTAVQEEVLVEEIAQLQQVIKMKTQVQMELERINASLHKEIKTNTAAQEALMNRAAAILCDESECLEDNVISLNRKIVSLRARQKDVQHEFSRMEKSIDHLKAQQELKQKAIQTLRN